MSNIKYSWKEMYEDTIKLCDMVEKTGFRPDNIIGIARGGIVPATIASHYVDCELLVYDWSLRDRKKRDIKGLDKVAIRASGGEKFLIIEDIVDSGDTLYSIKERMFDTKNNIMYSALWFNPSQTIIKLDFWSRIIDRSVDDSWVVFPWETLKV